MKGVNLVAAVWCIIIGGIIWFAGGDHWPINAKILSVVSIVIGLGGVIASMKNPGAAAGRQ